MLPKITELELNIEQTETLPTTGKSFLFDFEKGDFVLKDGKMVEVNGKEALKVWIEMCLKTEKYRFEIYKDVYYGVSIEDLLGSNYPRSFIESEIKREVTAALTKHPSVRDISEWRFERDGKWMHVQFKVNSVEDSFEQEVNFNV